MDQDQRRGFLIESFLSEREDLCGIAVPEDAASQRELLRGLMNVRKPGLPSEDVLEVQDSYLRMRLEERETTKFRQLEAVRPHLYLWKGDITTLECDAIVNAANSGMTGCWSPNHSCIDNCIHTFAGVQLRWECDRIMRAQGHPEPTGRAKITPAYNLPCKHVIHTVGPIVDGWLTDEHRALLASSYRSCYELAKEHGLRSMAYCCVSTGVFGFPQEEAARIAIGTVDALRKADSDPLDVVFNVFTDADLRIYSRLLS